MALVIHGDLLLSIVKFQCIYIMEINEVGCLLSAYYVTPKER